MNKNISTTSLGVVEVVSRADGQWSRWIGLGEAEGVSIGDGDSVETAGQGHILGMMTLTEYIGKRSADDL